MPLGPTAQPSCRLQVLSIPLRASTPPHKNTQQSMPLSSNHHGSDPVPLQPTVMLLGLKPPQR